MDTKQRESLLEELCQMGCRKITVLLQQLDQNNVPDELKGISSEDCTYLYNELKSIMDVYGGKSCEL